MEKLAASLLAVFSAFYMTGADAQGVAHASIREPGNFPAKPLRMVVPLAPGGGSDIVGRILATAMSEGSGATIVVDNRPGAGSTVGTSIAAHAPADGYTLLVSSSSIAISPALYKNLDFDIQRNFTGVTLIASQPSILAVHSSVTANSVKELIALAKAQPGKLAYGSAGIGSATHLGAELFKYSAGIDVQHIPYKSAGQATTALLSGEVQMLITNMASVLPQARSGRVKLLAISSTRRSPLVPDLPTVAEAGVPGFEYATWYGMLVPAGTPQSVVDQLHEMVTAVVKNPRYRERFTQQGLDVYAMPPKEFEAYLGSEVSKWNKVVQAAHLRAE